MRKIVLAAVVAVVAFLVYKCIAPPPPTKNVWNSNKIVASYEAGSISEKIGEKPDKCELYIDASGSMESYFMADGASMINTLSEIKNLHATADVYFMDNPRPYTGMIRDILGSLRNQPKRSNTLFHQFFEAAACKLDTVNTIVYLVTDGIMSIHDTSKDMSTALAELRGNITRSLKGHGDLAVAIFRYIGGFKGKYWNSRSQPVSLKEQIERPYYIIALGRKETMRWLQSLSNDKLNNPESLFMGLHDFAGHSKAVFMYGDSGMIENSSQPVDLLLELPSCLEDIDPADVKLVNSDKILKVDVKKAGNHLTAFIPVTEPLKHENGKVRISLSAPNGIPVKWTGEWNCEDDSAGPDSYTTYGLKALVEGIFEGIEKEKNLLSVDYIYRIQ